MTRVLAGAAIGAALAIAAISLMSSAAAIADDAWPTPSTTAAASDAVTVQVPGVLGTETDAPQDPGGATGGATGTGGRTGSGSAGSTGGGSGAGGGSGTDSGSTLAGEATATKFRLVIRPWRIHPGERFSAEGGGFAPGESVAFALFPGGRSVGSFTARSDGEVIARAAFPRSAGTGLFTVQATGATSKRVAAADISVVGAAIPASNWWGIAIVTIGILVALGAILLAFRLGFAGARVVVGAAR